jgi:hypothetical protein
MTVMTMPGSGIGMIAPAITVMGISPGGAG